MIWLQVLRVFKGPITGVETPLPDRKLNLSATYNININSKTTLYCHDRKESGWVRR